MEIFRKNLKKIIFPMAIIISCFVLQLTSLYNYLLFHSLAELFTVIIAFGIFAVAWSSRRFINNDGLLVLGIGYFFVGGMDLFHTLSYDGMMIFPEHSTNLPTQLWIAARYMEALSFIGAFILLQKNYKQERQDNLFKADLIFIIYLILSSGVLLSIFYWDIFPDAYVEGTGLTAFKIISEYIISALFIVSLALLFKKRSVLDSKIFNLLSLSLMVKVISELFFSGYVGVDDFLNMLGHLLKFISFFLLYKAILEIGLMKPYRFLFLDLKRSQEEYRLAQNELQQRIKDDLVEAYKYIGVANRRISLLLEIEEHSKDKKNKQDFIMHVINTAKSACHANVAMMYRHESGDMFSLVFEEGADKSVAGDLVKVRAQEVEFIKNMIEMKERINSPCELYDIGCFNRNKKLNYFVATPFILGNMCKGFLFLGFEERSSIAQQELEFLDVFSIHISSALAKLKVIEEA